jgi:hypothetical protein
MLSKDRKKLAQLDTDSVNELAHYLCHNSPAVRPIFECVKVYARIHETGSFTYARHPFDLGTHVITAAEISARMNCKNRELVVRQALHELEHSKMWPFSPGSSSWVLLEILHPDIRIAGGTNRPTIIFRQAVRLSSKGNASSTPMLEKMFAKLGDSLLNESSPQPKFQFVVDPVVHLRNISGTGVYTKFVDELSGIAYLTEGKNLAQFSSLRSHYNEAIDNFVEELFENNFDILNEANPGVYFRFRDEEYLIRPKSFDTKKKDVIKKEKSYLPPLPIFGMIK